MFRILYCLIQHILSYNHYFIIFVSLVPKSSRQGQAGIEKGRGRGWNQGFVSIHITFSNPWLPMHMPNQFITSPSLSTSSYMSAAAARDQAVHILFICNVWFVLCSIKYCPLGFIHNIHNLQPSLIIFIIFTIYNHLLSSL